MTGANIGIQRMNEVWVNAVGLVYRDSRPEPTKDNKKTYKEQRRLWGEKVDQAIDILRHKTTLNETEFRQRTMSEKP